MPSFPNADILLQITTLTSDDSSDETLRRLYVYLTPKMLLRRHGLGQNHVFNVVSCGQRSPTSIMRVFQEEISSMSLAVCPTISGRL